MKKVFFVLSMLLSVTLFSCSGNDDDAVSNGYRLENPSQGDDSGAWKNLRENLKAVDAEFGKSSQTRIGGGVTNIWPLNVIYVDCIVGYCAYQLTHCFGLAVICGSIASERAKEKHYLDITGAQMSGGASAPSYSFGSTPLDNLFLSEANNRTAIDSVGYWHNQMILDINDDNNFSFNYIYSDSIYDDVCGYYAQGNLATKASLLSQYENNNVLRSTDSSVKTALSNDSTASGIHDMLLQQGVNEYGLQTLYDYTETLYDLDDSDVSSYASTILARVECSDLRPIDIERLKVGILIGYASRRLWSSYFNSGSSN